MVDRKFVDFKVICPKNVQLIKNMQITFVADGQKWFPLPCNGCDDFHGCSVCEKCVASLTLLFAKEPDVDVVSPLSPQL